jgi:hypothetical protein
VYSGNQLEEELIQSLPQLPTRDEQPRQIDLDPPLPIFRPPITGNFTIFSISKKKIKFHATYGFY